MGSDLKFIGIIPARYASSRFPGKPLVEIKGKPMIRRVYEQAVRAIDTVYVATDDSRIFDAVQAFGGKVVMTSPDHKSGTDRCSEAVDIAEETEGLQFDVVLNIQGDEPFIEPEQLHQVKSCFYEENTQIATLVKEIHSEDVLFDPNRPKVVLNARNEAIYFSRSVIPYIRSVEPTDWLNRHVYYMHIGLYGFRRNILPILTTLPQSLLEIAESLEQLRWIENGYRIKAQVTGFESYGIDTPEDLQRLLRLKYI
jgi:3-deoxy-manno-octulosonate cytidylyltransferase (CMP-KDO synthetase)